MRRSLRRRMMGCHSALHVAGCISSRSWRRDVESSSLDLPARSLGLRCQYSNPLCSVMSSSDTELEKNWNAQSPTNTDDHNVSQPRSWHEQITHFLTRWGVETNGSVFFRLFTADIRSPGCRVDPIPEEGRTDPKLFQIFFVWFSANMNVLA